MTDEDVTEIISVLRRMPGEHALESRAANIIERLSRDRAALLVGLRQARYALNCHDDEQAMADADAAIAQAEDGQ